MNPNKILSGDFVITTKNFNGIAKNAVGLVKNISSDVIKIYFIGKGTIVETSENDIRFVDVEKTGKGFTAKICNVCHILKGAKEFDKNQTDAKGKSTTRPSCKSCRKNIDGVGFLWRCVKNIFLS